MRKILLLLILSNTFFIAKSQTISITEDNLAVTENFNSLSNSGTSSTLPNGWYLNESGTNLNATYTAGTGSSGTGDSYSFGASASTDRTLGGLQSGSLNPSWGASYTNNTGNTITRLLISYVGKTWRVGTANRTDRIEFQYSTNATSLNTGSFTDVNELNYENLGQATGNGSIQNFKNISYKIINLNIPNGSSFWIKFNDYNASGADDGIGIDDFSLVANPAVGTDPDLSFNPAAITFSNQNINTSSTEQTYQINYANLNGTDLNLTTVNPFKISNTSGGVFQNSLVLNGLTGTGSKIIYVQFSPSAKGLFNGIVSHDGGGLVASSTLSVKGTGVDPNATSFAFENCTPSGSSSLSDGFSQFSVNGAQTWACTSFGRNPADATLSQGNALQISGFSGGNQTNEDWLISPSFNLTSNNFPILSFWSRAKFGGDKLQLKISSNYSGTGNPNAATWINIDGKFPPSDSDIWTKTDNIDLSAYKTNGVYIAMVYTSSTTAAPRWTIDDFAITNSTTAPTPEISTTTTNLNFGYLAINNTSDKPFNFSAANLTNDVFVNSTGDYQVSGTSAGPFSNAINFAKATVNNTSPTIYVRFLPTQNNKSSNGNINISTIGASDKNIILNGNTFTTNYSLDVSNYNIEWFGSTVSGQGPSDVSTQGTNVRTVIDNIKADIYGFAEVVDTTRFRNQVLPIGYNVIFSDFGSYADDKAAAGYAGTQKLAFMYKTDIIKPITTYGVLRDTYYPALTNNGTGSPFKNWSSGRFPFLMEANVVMNGVTEKVYFIELHSKANTGDVNAQIDAYNRRKGGADQLKTWLDANLAGKQVIIIGDYNDVLDPDKTIAPSGAGPGTSYSAFVNSTNYNPISLSLSLAGERSTAGFPTVIDNVVISNSLNDNYIAGSVDVLDEATNTITNYSTATSDHYPILSRYFFDATTLPIELGNFSAKSIFKNVLINWNTLSEHNNAYFLIERSINGKDFELVEKIIGAGNSNQPKNYQILDVNPRRGINYYRLKQVDFDGAFTYSKIVSAVVISGDSEGLSVYPNPVKDNLTISFTTENPNLKLSLFDTKGVEVFKSLGKLQTVNGSLNLELPKLNLGLYILQIDDNGKIFKQRLIKNK